MFAPTETHFEPVNQGHFYLVTSQGERGPFGTYHDAVNAAEHPAAAIHGVDPKRGYCVVDRSAPEDA